MFMPQRTCKPTKERPIFNGLETIVQSFFCPYVFPQIYLLFCPVAPCFSAAVPSLCAQWGLLGGFLGGLLGGLWGGLINGVLGGPIRGRIRGAIGGANWGANWGAYQGAY